jgi:imidazolonepropionase-like amidohydrolase
VDSAGAARLRAAGIYVISTLATLTAGKAAEAVSRSFRLLHRAGVPIVLGTDAGVLAHGSNARELVALTEAGLSPLLALRAATLNAAALLGSSRIGEIAVGKVGDFVVVEGDPLRDVGSVARPVMVLRGGRSVED